VSLVKKESASHFLNQKRSRKPEKLEGKVTTQGLSPAIYTKTQAEKGRDLYMKTRRERVEGEDIELRLKTSTE